MLLREDRNPGGDGPNERDSDTGAQVQIGRGGSSRWPRVNGARPMGSAPHKAKPLERLQMMRHR